MVTNFSSTTLTINGGYGMDNFVGAITGAINIVVSGTGTMEEFSGLGTYSGTTLIQSGAVLQSGGTQAIPASTAVTINSGATFQVSGFNTTVLSLAGSGGTVLVTNTTLSTGGIGAGNSTTYSGAFTGNGTIQKTGSGTFTLAGASAGFFTGAFNVNAGVLQNGAVNGIPTGSTVSLYYGAGLYINYNQTLAEVYGYLSTINFSNGSILSVGGDNGNSSFEGFLNGPGTFVKVGTGTFTVGSGSGDSYAPNVDTALNFNVNAGTLLLSRADGYNAIGGPVLISGGTLQQAIGNQIADTSVVTITAGTYNLAGFNESIGGLTGTGGNVALGGGVLTINQPSNSSYSGTVTGPGAIIKSGVGSLNMSGASAFAGSFTVNGGQLTLVGPVNATALTANSGGILEFFNSTVTLNSGIIQANTGGTAEYSNSTISNGYLLGAGSHTILNSGTTTFSSISTFNSTIINQNGPSVFSIFSNGGTLNSTAALTLREATITSSGIFNVSGTVSSLDFTSNGVINLLSGGLITNTGSNLYLGGGSRTYAAGGSNLSTGAGTTIQLNGALLVNNGTVSGTVDVNFGALASGTGNYTSAVVVNAGGIYAPGAYGPATVPPNTSTPSATIQPAAAGINTNATSAVVVTSNGIITVNGTDTLTLSGGLTAMGCPVTKTGTGTVALAPFTAASLNVSNGTMQLTATHPATAVLVAAVTVTPGANLDLTDNGIDITGANLAAVASLVTTGYANGSWTGTGINSSTAGSDPKHLSAIGVIQNNQGGTPIFSAANLFDAAAPGPSDILAKYTYYGDTNLDGKVDGSDYSRIDAAYLADENDPTASTGWFNGDFNYDGVVDGSDYTLIDNAFNTQGTQLSAEIATPTTQVAGSIETSVPEPAGLGVVVMCTMGSLGRRRLRRNGSRFTTQPV